MKTEDALKLARELIIGPRAKTYGDKIINHEPRKIYPYHDDQSSLSLAPCSHLA